MSKMVRAISDMGGVVISAIDSTDIVKRMEEIHKTSAVVSAALGRMLTASQLMASTLKSASDTFQTVYENIFNFVFRSMCHTLVCSFLCIYSISTRYIFCIYFDGYMDNSSSYPHTHKIYGYCGFHSTLYLSTHYQLCVFMYSSAANLKNADKLKPCAFAFVVRRSFSSLVIDTSAVALVSPPVDFFGVFTAAVTAASCSFSVSLSKLSKRLVIFFFVLAISIISLHSCTDFSVRLCRLN